MANQRIDQLGAETTPSAADLLPIYSIAGSDTKKITIKNLVQQGAALVDDASIPNAKISLSGISGTNLSAGTVAVSKLDTSTIPATGGVTVSSSNLQLVAPTTPIVRNAGTGSLEHAVSGATAGTYTKVTVDVRGHVTVGAAVAAADLPIAISGTVGVMSPGTGLAVTGGGVLNHSSSVTAGTTSGFTYNAQGHITGAVALAGADLPISTSSVIGAVRPGTGLSVDGNGILDVTAATNAALGGVIAGSDFSITTGTISLATQAGIAAGQYTKVTINSKGITTAGTVLSAGDIPDLAASQITSGNLDIARIAANTVTGAKLANYSISKISDAFPTADYISQLYFSPLEKTLYMWDGNVYQPIGVSYGQVVFSGTYDAGTNLITSVTTEGAAIGLAVGGALVSPVAATKGHYVVVDQPGTGTAPAPTISLSPPDMLLSNGTTWVLLDVSDTVTAQLASNIQVSPAGNISTTNVQSALQELDNEKLAKAGGTMTGALVVPLASAATPSLTFTGDLNTGVFSPGADQLAVATNGVGRLFVDASGNVGVGTASPNAKLAFGESGAIAFNTSLGSTGTYAEIKAFNVLAPSTPATNIRFLRDAASAGNDGAICFDTTGAERLRVTSAGLVGIGSSAPDALLTVNGIGAFGAGAVTTPSIAQTGDLNTGFWFPAADTIAASTGGSERARLDSSGRLLIGNPTARSNFFNSASSAPQQLQVEGTTGNTCGLSSICSVADTSGGRLLLAHQRSGAVGGNTILNSGDEIGAITFQGNDGGEFVESASISAQVDGTPGSDDMPGRLVFSTTADGASSPTERMRITNNGSIFAGKTSSDLSVAGFQVQPNGQTDVTVNGSECMNVNRNTSDGDLIRFRQDNTIEGTISVSGTTVSYNGAHLSRWSQLPSNAERTEILRGSVLSNIDEMCEWTDEENEQLNRMKVSDVEGDKNVAGVFQAWDDDDDTYTNDFYCAMTGDFIIRIGDGVTVERGDLLMSAGDGTAKPQDDDIIRSKTIAKVTSTNVSCTYDDGSYCVPCVLMAC